MAAPKGHPMWGNPLNPKKYTPTELWDKAIEYFEWCDNNPIMSVEQTKMPQRLDSSMMKTMKPAMIKAFLKQTIDMPLQRAYSIEGFTNFANISYQTFLNYESDDYNKDDKTYFEVCTRMRKIIDDQHFTGGMAGTFNSNIVTRKLGLADKKEMEVNTKVEQDLSQLTTEELISRAKAIKTITNED